MDRSTDWPWSWEEEVEWKADLEERDYDFLQELIDNAIEDTTAVSGHSLTFAAAEHSEESALEEYVVGA